MATSVNERRYLGEVIGRNIDIESLTIPTTGVSGRYYIATLQEVPGKRPEVSRNLTISTTMDFSNPMRQVTNRLPGPNEFVVQGQDVYFNESQAGNVVYARYVGTGTIVRAEDVESLKSRIVALEMALENITPGTGEDMSNIGDITTLMRSESSYTTDDGSTEFLQLNGQLISVADYPDLAAANPLGLGLQRFSINPKHGRLFNTNISGDGCTFDNSTFYMPMSSGRYCSINSSSGSQIDLTGINTSFFRASPRLTNELYLIGSSTIVGVAPGSTEPFFTSSATSATLSNDNILRLPSTSSSTIEIYDSGSWQTYQTLPFNARLLISDGPYWAAYDFSNFSIYNGTTLLTSKTISGLSNISSSRISLAATSSNFCLCNSGDLYFGDYLGGVLSPIDEPSITDESFSSIKYFSGAYYAITDENRLFSSTNGQNWQESSTPFDWPNDSYGGIYTDNDRMFIATRFGDAAIHENVADNINLPDAISSIPNTNIFVLAKKNET